MRSYLFVPADSEKKRSKALTVGADGLILDLEDSVAVANKASARPEAAAFIRHAKGMTHRPRLYVRINAFDTPYWREDLDGVMAAAPDGIILPKPRSGRDVLRLAGYLDQIEREFGLPIGSTRIVPIATEVPAALLAMSTFERATPRMEAITWGAEDLSAIVGSSATREPNGVWTSPYLLARNLCLLAAVASGCEPVDTVYVNFKDHAGLVEECRIAARDGFTGKFAIHPDQVATINAAFTPSSSDIEWAQDIEALFAAHPGAGALSLRGQMVDKPHAVRAARILARARLSGGADVT